MSKKDHNSGKLSEQEIINRRVDAMLNPNEPDVPTPKKGKMPPLDIFKDAPIGVAESAQTAPEVSGKLLDKVDDKIDENKKPEQAKPKPSIRKPAKITEPSAAPAPTPDPPKDPVNQTDPLDDKATDEAVEDIATKEGNTLLALQDAIGRKASRVAGSLAEEDRKAARRRRWVWFLLVVVLVVAVLFALPLTSYTCRWPVGIRLSVTTDILPSVCK